ncbi:helix-turn-helix domain-containing protein [Flavobacterium cyclinae]|uniref:helix-turn-helix domain-containing protein n=1 Tax=Flavobacterium cyclinae TaxID=2895947 RepID=UPI001E4BE5E6|nr:helix-turn-helix domain-containing protein [Flavobacterium cyclinae]UGS22329.1 helix-turn-helix domain-containing protein [Flavobacterium cyclinae]
MKKLIAIISVITNYALLQATPVLDSTLIHLSKSDYEFLLRKVNENEKNLKFKKAWLLKAKNEENHAEQIKAYRQLMINEPIKIKKIYADSIITVALKTKNLNTIGNAYLNKGIVFYENKELVQALNFYIKAESYLEKSQNQYDSNKAKYAIAQTKFYLGFYDEAIIIFSELEAFFIEENDRAYLNTIHALGLCNMKISNFNKVTYYNSLGLKLCHDWEIPEMIKYFEHSEAINKYHKKEYNSCIENLTKIIPLLTKESDFDNITLANFYIAKSHWMLNKKNQAIPYLLEVDKTFLEKKYMRPDVRENYELLIKYYTDKGDTNKQLLYINRLLEVDSIINHNYKNLSQKIFKEYDAKKLIRAKTEIENKMIWRNSVAYGMATILLVVSFIGIRKHRRKSKYYKQKFEEVMNASNIEKTFVSKTTDNDFEINPEIIETALKNLEKFEKTKKYLEKDMNLSKIAAYLKTNTKYASKIILKHRGKKTIDYINDLKIDYVIELLKTENKYRNYTNKALAEEVGFGSTQNFTRAFKNRTDISPTYFVQKINEMS